MEIWIISETLSQLNVVTLGLMERRNRQCESKEGKRVSKLSLLRLR